MPENAHLKRIVCLTDDDEDDRMLLHEALLALGGPLEILELSSAAQLIAQFSGSDGGFADYVFLDINMPGMDGLQCLEKVRNLGTTQTRIIIYTAESSRESMQRAFSLGADFYAVKPNRFEDLKDLVKRAFSKSWNTLGPEDRIFHIT